MAAPNQYAGDPESQSPYKTGDSDSPELKIRFVSLLDRRQIEGMDIVEKLLKEKGFAVEHFEYKVTVQSEVRRPINPMVKNGPTEKVKIQKRINIDTQLKALKQLVWRVQKESENVLLLRIKRIKGEPVCFPLIFDALFGKGKQVLVAGSTKQVWTQLLAKPDLTFKEIPLIVRNHTSCLTTLLSRSKRAKAMQSAMRDLQSFHTLPKTVFEKIKAIAIGKKTELSDAEAVNLLLLSDLYNRYAQLFENFRSDVMSGTVAVDVLSKQFAALTKNIGTEYLKTKLEPYLAEEDAGNCRRNDHLFILLYRNLKRLDEPTKKKEGTVLDRTLLFGLLKSIVFIARSQFDPQYWGRCLFFFDTNDKETKEEDNRKAVDALTDRSRVHLEKKHASSRESLFEQYVIHNVHKHVLDREIWISERHLPELERSAIEDIVMPNLHFRLAEGKEAQESNGLFVRDDPPAGALVYPVHFVAKAYGRIVNRRLYFNTKKLLEQGTADLKRRYGTLFFDIFYDRAVFEPGFSVSRKHYFAFLQSHFSFKKPQEIGYAEPKTETAFERMSTSNIVRGGEESMFAASFTNEDFRREYEKSRKRFAGFFKNLTKLGETDGEECNPVPIFLDGVKEGNRNFRSSHFRKQVRETFLYEELEKIVTQCCAGILPELRAAAVNDKIAVPIPARFDSVLFIGNTFLVADEYRNLQVRLLANPDAEGEDSAEWPRIFFQKFESCLTSEATAGRKGLLQAIRILQEYSRVSSNFLRYLSLLVLDRHIQNILIAQKEREKFSPAHIKYYLPDSQKLFVGNVRDTNLDPVRQNEGGGREAESRGSDTMALGKFLQAMAYYDAAVRDLAARRKICSNVLHLLDNFTDSLKKSKRWKSYANMTQKFHAIFSNPVENFDERLLNLMSALGHTMKKIVDKEEYKNGIVGLLHAEWKRRNPTREKEIYYFLPFLSVNAGFSENSVLKVRTARDFMRKLKRKRCLVLLAEGSKGYHIKQIIQIGAFVKEKLRGVTVFVETGSLSGETIDTLCREFPPKNLFVLNRLSPIAYDDKEAERIRHSTAGKPSMEKERI